jgi:riboflavin synthase
MFSGIITDVGRVRRLSRGLGADGGIELTIATAYDTADIALGASIACSGPCLTVVAVEPGGFTVQASAETLACSTLGEWTEGTRVNLERALKVGDELGGHIVAGHVDGIAALSVYEDLGDMARLIWRMPTELARFIAPKGSVALDGVSLTVNEADDETFSVLVIPHTLRATTFAMLKQGDRVNLEVDLMARYAARLLQNR